MILIPILFYILIILIIFIIKPPILFDKKNKLLSLDFIYPFIAIISYYLYLLLLLIIKE
jgi:hypothetical protein